MTCMFVSPPISAWLMNRNPWIAMFIGLIFMAIPIPVTFVFPETLRYGPKPNVAAAPPSAMIEPSQPAWKRYSQATWHVIHDSFAFLSQDMRLFFLVTSFMLHMLLVSGTREIALQYISTRYGYSLSKSTALLSIRAGLNLVLMLLVLPSLSNYLNRRPAFSTHPLYVDLLLGRASAILSAVGFLLIAIAFNMPLFIIGLLVNTSGWGLMIYIRSLAISLVEGHAVARCFALMGLMDTLGMVIGSPSLAGLFDAGVNWGGLWLGLPFWACAIVVAFIGVGLSAMKLGGSEEEDEEED